MIQSEALLNYCSPTPVLECDVNRRSVNIKKMPKEFSLMDCFYRGNRFLIPSKIIGQVLAGSFMMRKPNV